MDPQVEFKKVGQRLLHTYIDGMALNQPTKIAVEQILSFKPVALNVSISYRDLSNMTNYLACYLGVSDVRHFILSLAAVLLLSPRNTRAVHQNLITEANCTAIAYDQYFSSTIEQLSILDHIVRIQLPDLQKLLCDSAAAYPYPCHDSVKEISHKPIAVFHTSGTTGNPKLVPFTHGAVTAIDGLSLLGHSEHSYRVTWYKVVSTVSRAYNAFPLFHVAGFAAFFGFLFNGTTIVMGPPLIPPNAAIFNNITMTMTIESASVPPILLEELAQDPTAMDLTLSKLRLIFYGGGPLSTRAGNMISQKVHLVNSIGSTEAGIIPTFMIEAENWNYFHFVEKDTGIQLQLLSDGDDHASRMETDGTQYYEMVIVRDEDIAHRQPIFHNFPNLKEWRTKDLFCQHPSIPYYWKYIGRKDDIIVLSTGEKVHPVYLEDEITGLPEINATVVVGNQRPYPLVLVEPKDFATPTPAIIAAVSHKVETLNQQATKDARIYIHNIFVAFPEKPFFRTPKGSISRGQTAILYQNEIEGVYRSIDGGYAPEEHIASLQHVSSKHILESVIVDAIQRLLSVEAFGVSDDIFVHGMDSRQVHMLAASLSKILPNQPSISFLRNAVYMNPAPKQLATFLCLHDHEKDSEVFKRLLEGYSDRLPRAKSTINCEARQREGHHVLLTGSTGFIGSSILDILKRRSDITQITCIDRTRQDSIRHNNDDGGTLVPVNYLTGDLSEIHLALSKDVYSELLNTVTEIIHCQWPVNFNWPLTLFETAISGVVNLIDLAYSSRQKAHITFLSSVATVQGCNPEMPIPEERLLDPAYARGGYGLSKLVASELLHTAGRISGVRSTICRIGQTGGPLKGQKGQRPWPRRDWFPTLVHASRLIGCVPGDLGNGNDLDWLPVDVVSEALVDIAVEVDNVSNEGQLTTNYYHLTNPSVAPYQEILPLLVSRLGNSGKVVPLTEWNDTLEKCAREGDQNWDPSAANTMASAAALLEFYRHLESKPHRPGQVRLDTTLISARIPSLRDLGAVSKVWMETWLDQWG
ncbi:acetyl-CoA synthetase-like protein [Aspergillus granulosus]|uniref:Acetyl-CoA synthetase-like protein n=1 Tax=Aspergillus granulosus TaxID=176169 RepID=A0ABR4GYR1_9EURO